MRDTAERELATADSRAGDFSVTTFPLGGPSLVLLITARTRVTDMGSAADYLARCRRVPDYLDQHAARLRQAARDGLLPVAPLVNDAIRQLNDHLAHPERDPMLSRRPPGDWAGATAWRDDIERVIRDQVRPAIGRYVDLLTELLPRSRPGEQAGLVYVPGGVAAYACCVRNGTTLPFDLDELYRIGLATLTDIEDQIAEYGRRAVGTNSVRDTMTWLRRDAPQADADPMASAAAAITRAHEGIPGHHAQFSRLQLLPELPLLLTAFYVVPHGEGWGLYAERLADELGLYSEDVQRLGMLGCAAWRAVRLVVDTGLHARGWSRAQAREFALAHSPMPAPFVDAEIDRYIALPGQALGYLVGQREICDCAMMCVLASVPPTTSVTSIPRSSTMARYRSRCWVRS